MHDRIIGMMEVRRKDTSLTSSLNLFQRVMFEVLQAKIGLVSKNSLSLGSVGF